MATVPRSPVITRVTRPSSDVALRSQDWVSSGGLLTLLAVDLTVFRPPLFIRIERPSAFAAVTSESFVWSNALLTLYAAAPLAPFAQLDWPNPRGSVSSVARTQVSPLPITLFPPPTPGVGIPAIWLRRRRRQQWRF